ncbi:efflux RND transporter periplasmic adaptor subunit [Sneathiella sp.]|jgi:RND family efflux transporter MFP subunit|uniref:efflux RND transporter periplasmic adaptor subunit n=1 Tax=Sneathiella sp. TaxID=1964365 RepID=UPI0039E3F6E7
MKSLSVILFSVTSFLLGACDEPATNKSEPIRAVKLFDVSQNAGRNERIFSGKIIAANTANLSFPLAGTVKSISVNIGDKIEKGQILATLDPVPFELDVEAAEAELGKARSAAAEKEEDFKRNKQLFEKGWVSKAALEQAQYALETALSEVNFKTTRLNQAKRARADAVLTAPYQGVVAEKFAEPNEEVGGGKQILSLDAEGALEVSISVPENVISNLNMGMVATAKFGALPGETVRGRVTEISRVAGVGNVFPVKVSLIEPPSALRAGMSGEVSLVTQNAPGEHGFLIPLTAISASENLKDSFVYIFDPASQTLSRRPVIPETVRGNLIAVKGVDAGDLVVSAGVSFLSDGQKVKRITSVAN